jgi:phosphohistidine phosphatase SixA
MLRTLALLRHGLASGQGPAAELRPEGAAYLRRLAAVLDREGWRPAAIVTSPYRRARESAAVMATALRVSEAPLVLEELIPEAEPGPALTAVLAAAPLAACILVVTHLPLIGRLAQELIGEDPSFSPGTLVEIVREHDDVARLLRRIGASDLPAA